MHHCNPLHQKAPLSMVKLFVKKGIDFKENTLRVTPVTIRIILYFLFLTLLKVTSNKFSGAFVNY